MRRMDGISLLVGIALGGVVFAAVGYWLGGAKAQTASAMDRAAADAVAVDAAALRVERDALRGESVVISRAEAAAKASLAAVQESVATLRAQCDGERKKADEVGAMHNAAQVEIREMQTKVAERERAMKAQLEERERSFEELRRTVDQSREAMRETFKATGAELLQATGESLMKQAKEQFEGQRTLSAQELDARAKAMDAALMPLREQLVKQEELVRSLDVKREGDSKELGARLLQISDLQLKASDAANSLSSAMRDNRQRGRWGELTLRRVVEMAGLQMHVDFDEQTSAEGEGGLLRPDMVVHLPEGRGVPIDSKVPFNSYEASINPSINDAQRLEFRTAHAAAVRGHVRALHKRNYGGEFPGANGFTILYIPFESAYTAAFENDDSLFQDALAMKVYVMSPSTLLAMLHTVALHWSNDALTKNAHMIGAEAKELVKRVATFVGYFNDVGDKLAGATKKYNEAIGSFESRLLVSANRVAALVVVEPVKGGEQIDIQPRRLMLPSDPEQPTQ